MLHYKITLSSFDECWDFSLVAPREFPILEVDLFKLAIIKGGSELAYLSTVEVI